MTISTAAPPGRIAELVAYFLRLGLLGFGGPVALVGQMERELVTERKGGLDGDAVKRDVEVAAREAVAMDVAADRGAAPHHFVDLLPIDLLSLRGRAKRRGRQDRNYIDNTHECFLLFWARGPVGAPTSL